MARLSSLVVDQIVDLVARGQLVPGDRLPPERELAQQFGVGRNSVREALRELGLLGLVSSRHGDGTYVTAVEPDQLMAPFRSVLASAASRASLVQVLEFRRVLEPESAALAARNLDDEGRARMEAALRRFDSAVDRGADGARTADTDFHFAIARATNNPLIIGVQRALSEVLADFRSELERSSYERSRLVVRGHHAVFGAIVARDPEGARAAMAAHLDDVAAALPAGDGPAQDRGVRSAG